ncbi:DUF6538 domain-containing protein [Massilia sp. TS11]|uniref:DUF6538 domain-containing protein n=1 Tax=Massilia sp. TS11 TaxID=2908003 RepID=UPI001EDBE509|nr:DUF6538 domain-containing protein [Massilia sp. TS11]MCG2583516.1 hypothetical protein [Massilia sp. TS11]
MAANFLVLSRHGTVYYFRRRIPSSLRDVIKMTVIQRSLETSDRRLAMIRGRALAARTDLLFEEIMARKSDSSGITFDFTLEIPIDELTGRPKAIKVDAKPEEVDAVNAAIKTSLEALGNAFPVSAAPQSTHSVKATLKHAGDKSIEAAVEEYLTESSIKPASKATHRSKLNHAQAYFADAAGVLEIGQVEFVAYSKHVRSTIEHPSTQGHYITTVATFLNWHRIRAGLQLLTVKSLMPKKDTPDADDRAPFTLDQLQAIFENAKQYRKSAPCKFWASIAPAFLGCRLEELAQVHLHEDLRFDEDAGIWYLKFDGKPDPDGVLRKSLKKTSSWRSAPIHPALFKHGFVDFLLDQRNLGHTRPFEAEWAPREETSKLIGYICKWSHYISKWGGRELIAIGAKNHWDTSKLAFFHSMRHSFKQILGNAGVSSEISEALSGRRYGGADAERYEHLKSDHKRLFRSGIEPGLNELARVLDDVLST